MKTKIIVGLLLCAIAAGGFTLDSDGIFTYKVGKFEVYMLVESERDGNPGNIPDADEAVLKRYIPAEGFFHSTNASRIHPSSTLHEIINLMYVCPASLYMRREENQLDATEWFIALIICSSSFPHPGRIACCSVPNSRSPATKALHTACGSNTSIVSSS